MFHTDHGPNAPKDSEAGIALLAVMIGLTVVGILALGLVLVTKSGIQGTSFDIRSSERSAFFDAAVLQTALSLLDPKIANRPRIDGVPQMIDVMGRRVSVSVMSEFGKVDLNAADEGALERLFEAAGEGPAEAVRKATKVVDWRANGEESNVFRLFRTTDEILNVPSISPALYDRIKDSITVYSGRSRIDQSIAPLLALESTGRDHLSAEFDIRNRVANRTNDQISEVVNGKLVQGMSITGWAFLIKSNFNLNGPNDADQVMIKITGDTEKPFFIMWRKERC